MDFEERAGYALASWTRLEGELTDDLTRAVTCAFALVACADGDLAAREVDEFEHTLEGLELHLPNLDFVRVRRLFADISSAILSDPTAGRTHALAAIESVQGNSAQVELVTSAAELAVAADNRILERETSALDSIYAALGVTRR